MNLSMLLSCLVVINSTQALYHTSSHCCDTVTTHYTLPRMHSLTIKERLKKGAFGIAACSLSWFAVCSGFSTAQQSYECQDTDDYNALWASGLITFGVGVKLAYDGGRAIKQAIQGEQPVKTLD